MQDSNQFHAICLDTYPPCVYLNQVSHEIISFVHDYNEAVGHIKVHNLFFVLFNLNFSRLCKMYITEILGFLYF